MFEILFVILLLTIVFVYFKGHPMVKHYFAQQKARKDLVKKHARLHKCRNDLMMHFDWMIARQETLKEIENLGREIERVDREMNSID
jgi:vacuolar-type H+-ATPase subunit D/Vma8